MVGLLVRNHQDLDRFEGFLLHPGGRRVLDTAQDILGLNKDDLGHSWDALHHYGNLSSATALFVLDNAIKSGGKELPCSPPSAPAFCLLRGHRLAYVFAIVRCHRCLQSCIVKLAVGLRRRHCGPVTA